MATVLSQIRGIKMMGLESVVGHHMQDLRVEEIDAAAKARRLRVFQVSLCKISLLLFADSKRPNKLYSSSHILLGYANFDRRWLSLLDNNEGRFDSQDIYGTGVRSFVR